MHVLQELLHLWGFSLFLLKDSEREDQVLDFPEYTEHWVTEATDSAITISLSCSLTGDYQEEAVSKKDVQLHLRTGRINSNQ